MKFRFWLSIAAVAVCLLLLAGTSEAREVKGQTKSTMRKLVVSAVSTDGAAVSTPVTVDRRKRVTRADGSTYLLFIGHYSLDVPEGQKATIVFNKFKSADSTLMPKTVAKFATDATATTYTTALNVTAALPGGAAAIDLGKITVKSKLAKTSLNPLADVDSDGDGISDLDDNDDDNDAVEDNQDQDEDGDGILDENEDLDTDNDGTPDVVDPDDDNDGIKDREDLDADGDGILDWDGDEDHDGDTVPDAIDPDDDNDGIADNQDQDQDGDGSPDALEQDADNDGIPDDCDNDDDNDGIADNQDEDNDNDGILDASEQDTDGDGLPDDVDQDDDNDGVPDWGDNDSQALLELGGGRIVFALAGEVYRFSV